MVLELHVWGPAFGLPSIDPQCLATIAYFSQALPPQDEWILIPSSDPAVSPTNELPALKNGATWVAGFASIVDYLKKYSASHWDLDLELSAQQKADNIAYSSFVESRAQPLHDLSFYVSSENYTSVTRACYGELLYWPKQWTLLPQARERAFKRSEHLGLSSLDVDIASAQQEDQEKPKAHDLPRSFIARPRDTVSGLLRRPANRNQFRLEALTTELYEPLENLLGQKRYLLSETAPTSLDCLVAGCISPILWATLPQEWMKRSLESKHPSLARYIRRISEQCFGSPVSPSAVLQGRCNYDKGEDRRLPWQAPEAPRASVLTGQVLESILDTIPGMSHIRARQYSQTAAAETDETTVKQNRLKNREFYSQAAAIGAGVSAFVGYLFWEGIIKISTAAASGADRKSFGPAGAMLGLNGV